jgi:hypothetical protein
MALTPFQRDVCQLLAENRIRSGALVFHAGLIRGAFPQVVS